MKSVAASFLVIISILILPLISTTTFAEKIASDEELQGALEAMSIALSQTHVIALNCSDKEAFSIAVKQRMKVYQRYAEAGFTTRSIDALDKDIDRNIEIGKNGFGRICNRELLDSLIKETLKMDYDYLDDVLNRYVPLNQN